MGLWGRWEAERSFACLSSVGAKPYPRRAVGNGETLCSCRFHPKKALLLSRWGGVTPGRVWVAQDGWSLLRDNHGWLCLHPGPAWVSLCWDSAATSLSLPGCGHHQVTPLEHHPAGLIRIFYRSCSVVYSKQKKKHLISPEILYTRCFN